VQLNSVYYFDACPWATDVPLTFSNTKSTAETG
jgi:hypothetical protein